MTTHGPNRGGGAAVAERGRSATTAGQQGENWAKYFPSPDKRPFTDAQFARAPLHSITGQGGHMPFYRVTIGGQEYFAKRFDNVTQHDNPDSINYWHERPEHELAARAMAKLVGMGEHTLPNYYATRDGKPWVVTPFMPGRTLQQVVKDDKVSAIDAFRLMPEAQRIQTALFAYVISDADRIKPNFRVEASTGRVYSIDHARSFYAVTAPWIQGAAGQLLKFGIGAGAKQPFEDTSIPRAALERIVSQRAAIVSIAQQYRLDPRPIEARLSILQNVLTASAHPIFDDIYEQARAYGVPSWTPRYLAPQSWPRRP